MISSSLSDNIKGRIREISIEKKCEEHAFMHISVIPDDLNSNNEFFSFVKIDTEVEASIDGKLIMCGKIKSIEGKNTYSGASVDVLVVSDSIDSDTTETSRVYQSPKKKYKDIYEKISSKATFVIEKDALADKEVEEVIIQENETDFQFAKKIAEENNTRIFVCSNQRGNNRIVIGDSISKSFEIEDKDIISAKIAITEYCESIEFEYKKYIELGTKVKYNNQEYVLVYLNAIYKNDSTRFHYRIERIAKQKEDSENNVNLISLGKAKVTNNKDDENLGRIQVEFTDLEDALNNEKIWIQYINTFTAGDGGVFFVPDVDEIVEVIFQNNKCYAYGCIREKAVSEKIQDTDKKSIKLLDKTCVIEKDKITFEAWDYICEIKENEAYIKNKNCDITIKDDSVILKSDKSTLVIDKNQINSKVNGKSEIKITDSNIISKTGNGTAKLTSNSLEIAASSAVNVSTMKFNIK